MINEVATLGFQWKHFFWAVSIGAMSAVSLPIGTFFGLTFKPSQKITGLFAAFGAGALFAALSIELVAPTVAEITKQGGTAEERAHAMDAFWALIFGATFGGTLFLFMDNIINSKGGFLRKTSTMINHLSSRRSKKYKSVLKSLSKVQILRQVPPDLIGKLVELVNESHCKKGDFLFREGASGDRIYLVQSGLASIQTQGKEIKQIGADGVIGELALVTGNPRKADVRALEDLTLWSISREDFVDLQKEIPELSQAVLEVARKRLEEFGHTRSEIAHDEKEWTVTSHRALDSLYLPNSKEIEVSAKEEKNSGVAIWLGLMIDGIPEAFVIGATFFSAVALTGGSQGFASYVPYTLLAGLFLSNFPEALSSSVVMEKHGMSRVKIYMMWISLVFLTSTLAGVGYLVSDSVSHTSVVAIEGLAAGAMLTMIAAAMIPEAVHLGGGNIAGASTLMGFLSVLIFKLLE